MKRKVAIKIEDLTVSYTDKPALWDVDLEIMKGSLCAIIGPNGAGKSTLVKSIIGLLKPLAGTIKINEQNFSCPPKNQTTSKTLMSPQRSQYDTLIFGGHQCPRCGFDGSLQKNFVH